MNPSRQSTGGRGFGLRFLLRLIGWGFSAAIALIVLAYVALPVLLRYGLPHALARYGVASAVEGASVNLMREEVTLVGFQIGQPGGPAIRWGEVTARVDMAELLKGNIRIIDFQVKKAQVDLARLRVSEWRPPARAAAIPDLNTLNINVGNVVLRDLEFIGLSETIGQSVQLRSLSVGSLSHLEAGDRVAIQLTGAIGGASLRLAGAAQMVDNLPVVEGRYDLAALELNGFGHIFGLAAPGSVGGRIDASGTFSVAFVQGEGVIHAGLSGGARANDLELEVGDTSVIRTRAEWNGDVQVFWPVAGGIPRINARGAVASPKLEAAHGTSGARFGIVVDEFVWDGEMAHGSDVAMEGKLSAGQVRIDSRQQKNSRLNIELSDLRADSKYKSGSGAFDFNAPTLTAESAKFFQQQADSRQSAAAFQLVMKDIRLNDDRSAIGRLEADSAEATLTRDIGENLSHSARLIRFTASGVDVPSSGSARIAEFNAAKSTFEFNGQTIDVSQASVKNAEIGANRLLEAKVFSASSLRQKSGELETWGTVLEFSSAGISFSGEVFSDGAAAESLSQTMAGDPLWEANGVHVTGLSIGSERIASGRLSAGSFAYGRTGRGLVEIDTGEASDFSIRYATGVNAGRLKVESMRHRRNRLASLELDEAELTSPGITFDGMLSAEHLDASRARYVDADANISLVEALKLGKLSGRLYAGLRIDAAHADRFSHDRAAGADFRAEGAEFSRMEISESSGASAVTARLGVLQVELADGPRLALEDVVVANPARTVGGKLSGESGRLRRLEYATPGNRVLSIADIEFGPVDGDENGGHRIGSVSAASAEASDPAAAYALKTGALQIAGLRISAAGVARADAASANTVTLTSTEGEPAADFSTAQISLDGLSLGAGGGPSFGHVVLDQVALTLGLDDKGEFVLPVLPFLSADPARPGAFSIDRLETRQSARVDFFDRSTSPPFEIVFSPLRAWLENFHAGDADRQAKFAVEGTTGEFSNLKASGEFSFEKDGPIVKVSGKITAFELDRLNMYAAKHAKRAIRSGRADAAFDIAVEGRKLSGTMQFVFSNVAFEPVKSSVTPGDQNASELSLQHSIAMLKDKDGIVRLTVPLSGSLDDPQFDFSDGLVQAVMKALRSTVKLTFKPLGLLVGAADLIGGSNGLEFRPVAFDPGDETLSEESLGHLDTLARELTDHPGVEVRICGRAVSADRISVEQRRTQTVTGAQTEARLEASAGKSIDAVLKQLAANRASAVRRYLQDKSDISPERLLPCPAEVETAPGRLPRVDLPVRVETQSTPAAASRASQ